MEPTKGDLESPLFDSIWEAIKGWEVKRGPEEGIGPATGTDVMAILEKIREGNPVHLKTGPRWIPFFVWKFCVDKMLEIKPRGRNEDRHG